MPAYAVPFSSDIEPLILDLVEWIAAGPRTYDEVMAAWRTSCPRLPVWEDAVDRGLVARSCGGTGGGKAIVSATPEGCRHLAAHGRGAALHAARSAAIAVKG